jgi:enamine deaminase RidA (YjgF/YER057c/UK114 family)
MNDAPPHVIAPAACRVRFGSSAAAVEATDGRPELRVALPVLAGTTGETLLDATAEPMLGGDYTLFSGGPLLAGFAVAAADLDLEVAAGELYQRLFAATAGLHLYRIWNYVPHINAHAYGLENYRRFCRGRSLAFEKNFGRGFRQRLPAASAVGASAGPLAVGFLAGNIAPRYFENPRQVPAFEYPREYGPRPPSFSRATVVDLARGRQLFISGTAAILGHATVAADDLELQLACVVENLRLIGETAGAGRDLGAAGVWRRSFKVYVRHAADLDRAKARLERDLLRAADIVSYLQADICRTDLLVEIEAVLTEAA